MDTRIKQLPGLMLFIAFGILTLGSMGFDLMFSRIPHLGTMLVECCAFLPPIYIMRAMQSDSMVLNFRTKQSKGSLGAYLGFTVKFALAISFLSFLANFCVYVIVGATRMNLTGIPTQTSISDNFGLLSFLSVCIVPPLVEEFFVRGALFSAFENVAGTGFCIVLSGICFAMLHGSLVNFVGPLIAGCGYAFLAYSFGSIWPAVLAHFVNNLYYYIVNHLITLYSSFGIWHYFTIINVILFLLTFYLTLRSLEQQLRRHTLRTWIPNDQSMTETVRACLVNPGFFIFVSAFVISVALQ